MDPWYRVVTLRKEVREGRSFNPDEFAIALEQVVSGGAPEDYRDPVQFLARTCFTRALREHTRLVLRRLAGQTEGTAPVMALITQFGGGKTHTLTTLYHLARNPGTLADQAAVRDLLAAASLSALPRPRVAVFVGNAWDPGEGRETPWVDVARQLAGDTGVQALGSDARTKAPGTERLRALFEAAGGSVLVLFDEVLNFLSRHRDRAEAFRDFLGNLVRAMTGTTGCAAMLSLPQSRPEMSNYDLQWQAIIEKEVGRVAKRLIANDEAEIGEVVRRRLVEDLGPERARKRVAKAYADWGFERRAQLPPEWTAIDTATSEKNAREHLQGRFEACYPFHPATLSVFQRKWQALPQYQQTRGTLAMLAQWIAWAAQEHFRQARTEPLISLGSAPLHLQEFRGVVLGQLGESRLNAAIDADIAGAQAHARTLDADLVGPLRDLHRRVGTAIFFESTGGQSEKVAHLPELRFAIGEPELDTTSIDNAALALEARAFFLRRVGSDGFQVRHQATLKKAKNDRRASLDEDTEIRPAIAELVRRGFEKGASIPVVTFPEDSAAIADSPRLTLVVADPGEEWTGRDPLRVRVRDWIRQRGAGPRLYPGAMVWCLRRPGRDLREKVEEWLAWRRIQRDLVEGVLGSEFEPAERSEVAGEVQAAEADARDEVWASYRFVALADRDEPDGLRVIDLGAGHASASETLVGRIITALKTEALVNESVGAGYIERNWPAAFRDTGAWPLAGLRKSFVDGSLTRLLDPDRTLRGKLVELVERGEFALAAGARADGTFARTWYREPVTPDEVDFSQDVYLLRKERVAAPGVPPGEPDRPDVGGGGRPVVGGAANPPAEPAPQPPSGRPETGTSRTLRLAGTIPPEVWNRLGTRVIPKLRGHRDVLVSVVFEVTTSGVETETLKSDLRQVVDDLDLAARLQVSEKPSGAGVE